MNIFKEEEFNKMSEKDKLMIVFKFSEQQSEIIIDAYKKLITSGCVDMTFNMFAQFLSKHKLV